MKIQVTNEGVKQSLMKLCAGMAYQIFTLYILTLKPVLCILKAIA